MGKPPYVQTPHDSFGNMARKIFYHSVWNSFQKILIYFQLRVSLCKDFKFVLSKIQVVAFMMGENRNCIYCRRLEFQHIWSNNNPWKKKFIGAHQNQVFILIKFVIMEDTMVSTLVLVRTAGSTRTRNFVSLSLASTEDMIIIILFIITLLVIMITLRVIYLYVPNVL